jgi:primosomal protein N' (replication factor Y)
VDHSNSHSIQHNQSPRLQEPTQLLGELVFDLPVNQTFTYAIPSNLSVKVGMRVRAPFGKRTLVGYVINVYSQDEPVERSYSLKDIQDIIDPEPVFTNLHLSLAQWMTKMYFSNLGECLGIMIPSGKKEREVPGGEEEAFQPKPLDLTPQQQYAVSQITSEPSGMFYLYGMTGSGKTEVFLQVAKKTLEESRGVVYLVPEIALTAQVVDLIRARFGTNAAVLHSRLTPSQRLTEWRRIVRGEARVVIGARSAIFAPVPDLGLIILDEEHETTYKSQNSPRYHARQIAMRRSSQEGARLIMGSATPSAEAWNLMESGGITKLQLNARVAGGKLPDIEIVQLSVGDGVLSPRLIEEMELTKQLGKQTILFLNRRGFSYFFFCRSCGADMKCRNCSTSLTYHKSQDMLVCHYCGYKTKPHHSCSECGSLDVGYAGFGTEQVEETVRNRFPQWTIARLDGDTVATKGVLETTIRDFRQGKIDVLLGTQMIAKGLNFPGVRLVGLVLADSGLHMPDFRSAERTFGLITQVSGRAGRFSDDGKVLIQTFNPKSKPIQLAALGQIDQFYDYELSVRRTLAFPPYSRMIRLVYKSKNYSKAMEAATIALRSLNRWLESQKIPSQNVEILGPADAPLSLIGGVHRIHILLLSEQFSLIHSATDVAIHHSSKVSGVNVEVDVDPVSLM